MLPKSPLHGQFKNVQLSPKKGKKATAPPVPPQPYQSYLRLPEVRTAEKHERKAPIPTFPTGMKKVSGQRGDKGKDALESTNIDMGTRAMVDVYTYLNGL